MTQEPLLPDSEMAAAYSEGSAAGGEEEEPAMKQKEMGDGDKRKKRAQDRRGWRASMLEPGRGTGSITGDRQRECLRWYE